MSAKPSILLVEGSRTQAERLRLLLQAYDYLVAVATDGGAAVAAARARRPALIISGVALSGMDGYDMCAALKQDADLRHIPVALLTALTDVDDLMRGLKAQVDYYIAKPYQEEDLLARIAAILDGVVRTVGHPGREQLEVVLRGERKTVASDRQQLLRLLLSTYENYNALLRQNRSLSTTQLQLKTQAQHLQEECERLQSALKQSAAPSASSPESVAERAASGERILIVDDTVLCQTVLRRLVEKLGCAAEVAANGADAVEAYLARGCAAVLMDVQMPVMNGFEATARIRRHEQETGRHVPIIAVTAHTQAGDRERCLAAGMDDYLPKPVTLEMLKRVLAPRLSRSPAAMKAGASSSDQAERV